jgi:hypothetical protein
VHETHLEITVDDGDDGTLTMPDVGLAEGRSYYIKLLDDGTNKAITLDFPGDPPLLEHTTAIAAANTWASSNTLTADNDYVVLKSLGHVWLVEANVTT